jgi:WD40 repeat protein
MAHRVFICHSSKDKQVADAACAALEAQRIPCWIAPRDILAGEEYGKSIVDALGSCQIVLLIFSHEANNSPQVRREIERSVSKGKIIVPFRIEDVLPSDAMEFALGNTHWLDALTPPMERYLLQLCDTISRLIERHTPVESPLWSPPEPGRETNMYPQQSRFGLGEDAGAIQDPVPGPVLRPARQESPGPRTAQNVARQPAVAQPSVDQSHMAEHRIDPEKQVEPSPSTPWWKTPSAKASGITALIFVVALVIALAAYFIVQSGHQIRQGPDNTLVTAPKSAPAQSAPVEKQKNNHPLSTPEGHPSALPEHVKPQVGENSQIQQSEAANGSLLRTLSSNSAAFRSIGFSPDGRTLASESGDNALRLWDVASGRLLRRLQGDFTAIAAFSPDGRTLASGTPNGAIILWNVAGGQMVRTLQSPMTCSGCSVAFSPNGRTVATGGNFMRTINLLDVAGGQVLRNLYVESETVYSIAFSPDGRTLASASQDKSIKLWDVASGQLLRTLQGNANDFMSVAFNPQGRTLASGGLDNTIQLWDATSGQLLRTLQGHSSAVYSVAYSPNGHMLASGSADKSIKLWDVSNGQLLRTLHGHTDFVYSVAFSPDGRTLASASADKTIKFWDLASANK